MESSKNAIAKNKLAILYILNKMDIRLSDTRLIEAADTLGLMDYFDLNSALHDLTENQLADMSTSINGTFYQITEMGKNTLEFFEKELLMSVRQKISAYCEENREQFRLESQLFSEYIRLSEHQYRVNLKVLENDIAVFELSFFASTKAEADKYVQGWKKKALLVYQKTFENLLS